MSKRITRIIFLILSVVLISALMISLTGCSKQSVYANAEKLWYDTVKEKSVDTTVKVGIDIPFGDTTNVATPSVLTVSGEVTMSRKYVNKKLSYVKVNLKTVHVIAKGDVSSFISTISGFLENMAGISPEIKNLIGQLTTGITLSDLANVTLKVKADDTMEYDYTVYVSKVLNLIGMKKESISNVAFREMLDDNSNIVPKGDLDMNPIAPKYNLPFINTVMGYFNAGDIRLDRISIFDTSTATFVTENNATKATIDPYVALAQPLNILYGLADEFLSVDQTAFYNRVEKVAMIAKGDAYDAEALRAKLKETANKVKGFMSKINIDALDMKSFVNSLLTLDSSMSVFTTYKDKQLSTMKGKLGSKLSLKQSQVEAILGKTDNSTAEMIINLILGQVFRETVGEDKVAHININVTWDSSYFVNTKK